MDLFVIEFLKHLLDRLGSFCQILLLDIIKFLHYRSLSSLVIFYFFRFKHAFFRGYFKGIADGTVYLISAEKRSEENLTINRSYRYRIVENNRVDSFFNFYYIMSWNRHESLAEKYVLRIEFRVEAESFVCDV